MRSSREQVIPSKYKIIEFTKTPGANAQIFVDSYILIDDYLQTMRPLAQPTTPTENRPPAHQLTISQFNVLPSLLPIKHRPSNLYERLESNVTPTFHDVFKVKKRNSTKNAIYFFKQNKFNTYNSLMYELEATFCGFYKLIAPQQVSSARAHYNDLNQYNGVTSKGIPGFKSTIDDPLKEEDLVINALKYFSIDEFEELDSAITSTGTSINGLDDKQILFEKTHESGTATITAKDLKNYRIVRGLAIGLTLSHFFEEDDLHRGNMSKDGKRIDFDMSGWLLLFLFKETGFIDWTFRHPGDRFKLSEEDIKHSPNLTTAQPFYWPTKPAPYIPETIREWLSTILTISKNAFASQENLVYQKLETHPVYIYHKYATWFKILMSAEEMYRNIAKLHMREEISVQIGSDPEKLLINILAEHIEKRRQDAKKILIQMSEFQEFMQKNGDKLFEKIICDFSERNQKLKSKLTAEPRYLQHLFNIDQLYDAYELLKKEIDNKTVKTWDGNVSMIFGALG